MKREELLQEIADIDKEINRTIASTELPTMKVRPFPIGSWVVAALLFGWAKYGDRIPGAFIYHSQTATYAVYGASIMGIIAVVLSVFWLFRDRSHNDRSDAYLAASRDARELQERRRDLQAELRSLSKQ